MASGSKQCRECGALNSADEARCVRCGAPFPSAVTRSIADLLETILGRETPATRLFVASCVVVFLGMALDAGGLRLFGRQGGIDALLFGGDTDWEKLRWGAVSRGLVPSEPWRLLSATFVHFGALHVGLNMMAIVSLGRALEPQLGSARYLVTLLGTAFVGFVASHVWYSQVSGFNGLTAGASGGVLGLAGALVGYLYARRNPAYKQIGTQVVLFMVLFAVMLPVNNAAHIGGLLSGLPLGYAFCKERGRQRRTGFFRLLAGGLVIASVASVLASRHSDVWRAERARELMRQELVR